MDLHDEHGMPGTAVPAADAVQQPAAQPRTLLLVDDEPNILASLKRLLRRDAYHILTAGSGQEGLDVLASHAVDVIVSDQRMPGMLGADFLRKAKLLCPQTIRIMLSGYTELQAVTDAVNEGAIFKFLTKPWDDHQLREHIAEAFRLKGIDDDNVRLNEQLREANLALAAANAAMQALVRQQQHQISRDEVSLGIARELLQFLPLPVIGLDDEGMIAFINAAAANLFERGAALLGNEAALVLPQLFDGAGHAPPGRHRWAAVCGGGPSDGRAFALARQPGHTESSWSGNERGMSESGREISMEQAQEGMVLAQALSDASGAVLLAQGATLTAASLTALRRRNVERCYVVMEETPDPAAQAHAEQERLRRLERLAVLFRATPPDSAGAQLLALLQRYRQGDAA